jgi:hypothetical protein
MRPGQMRGPEPNGIELDTALIDRTLGAKGKVNGGVYQVSLKRAGTVSGLCAVPYKLSQGEAQLYKAVTDYVRQEFNRAEALQNDKRAGTVGFALTILQRRLAFVTGSNLSVSASTQGTSREPSPRVGAAPAGGAIPTALVVDAPALDAENVEDLEEAPDDEVEAAEEQILDQATAARTIAELKAEIETLKQLEGLALAPVAVERTEMA